MKKIMLVCFLFIGCNKQEKCKFNNGFKSFYGVAVKECQSKA